MSDCAVPVFLSVEVGVQVTSAVVSTRIEVDGDTRLVVNTSGLTCGDIRGAVASSTGIVGVVRRLPAVRAACEVNVGQR